MAEWILLDTVIVHSGSWISHLCVCRHPHPASISHCIISIPINSISWSNSFSIWSKFTLMLMLQIAGPNLGRNSSCEHTRTYQPRSLLRFVQRFSRSRLGLSALHSHHHCRKSALLPFHMVQSFIPHPKTCLSRRISWGVGSYAISGKIGDMIPKAYELEKSTSTT